MKTVWRAILLGVTWTLVAIGLCVVIIVICMLLSGTHAKVVLT